MRTSFSLLVALLFILNGDGGSTAEVTPVTMPKRPCPIPDDIQPCVCVFDEDLYQLDLDCSAVLDEDDLYKVFQATFPFKVFRKFTIYENSHLNFLPSDVFGEVQFEEISITKGVLNEVQNETFASSYLTAVTIDLSSNHIEYFPFHEVSSFTLLETLNIGFNNLTSISPMTSPTLKLLYLNHNTLYHIAANTFVELPSVQEIHLAGTQLQELKPETFTGLQMLTVINMETNKLRNLAGGTFNLSSVQAAVSIDLTNNLINTVNIGAFTGNPLDCGCDLEWVVLNQSRWLPYLYGAICYDGITLQELDPTFYINYC
ncbi:oplophorus-luciferin 2-monooxygenase non-catalytic subunit isoform X2 [Cherax quadricarinatus]|uniref:oplophorus-luciferin 2-monooxygenase non-catalytic subunit isoform X2 n=1 Tax=Cherax quadricarinatus TaxID=27406 RepID=UPI0023796F1F|nr:oplophorus-luciferin 2-monooxygenase non-catalytic subunit-like isoform X2 [Cherax quadricarinatus]